ncbi:DUF4214 domain-containing protein [Massilia sp. DD77]|uniref:DUF4214 domain-containing protein n=1 Tax=Massilia sp. DD77 TaxID=3109349 RepID=UPI002FFE433B
MAITTLTHLLSVPKYAQRPYLSADGRSIVLYVEGSDYFLFGNQYKEGLVVLDLVDGSVVPLAPVGGLVVDDDYSRFIGMNGDASQVYFNTVSDAATLGRAVYMTDTTTGTTTLALPFPGGAAGAAGSFGLMSANGRYMLEETPAKPGGSYGLQWRDRQTGETRQIEAVLKSQSYTGAEAAGISDDGRMVMIKALSPDIVPGDTNNGFDYFVQDMATGKIVAVQSATDGTIGNDTVFEAVLSANGRYVAFSSMSTNLVADGAGTAYGSYVKDLHTGAIVRVSEDLSGKPLPFGATISSISADGRYVALRTSDRMGVAPADEFGEFVFVKDMQTGGIGVVNADQPVEAGILASAQLSDNGEMLTYMAVNYVDLPIRHAVFHVFAAPRPTLVTAAIDGHYLGSAGADTLAGALGNDSYLVNHAGDIVLEYAGQGTDLVTASINYSLPDTVENLQLSGSARNGTGNALNNEIRGTTAANTLRGGAGDDVLEGMGGSDTLYGDGGFDTVSFSGSVRDYTFTKTSWRHEVTKTGAGGAVSHLYDIEHLKFADAEVTFETTGKAAMAYRVYQAAFDRTPDLAGLGYWISRMEAGMTLDQVARSFIDSVEFKGLFGTAPTNAQLVEKMYQNVLHRKPDAAGLDFWVDVMERGALTRSELLTSFSESTENQDALITIIGHGIAYTPYGG